MHRYCNKNGSWYHRPNHEGVMEIWEMKENCSQEFNNASEVLEALDANVSDDKKQVCNTSSFSYKLDADICEPYTLFKE